MHRLSAAALITLPLVAGLAAAELPPLDRAAFGRHIEVLASDAFEGRAPGSAGEALTIDYIRQAFEAAGLEPGLDGDWLQPVPAIETLADTDAVLTVQHADGIERFAFGDEMTIGSGRGETEVRLEASPIVFVGYGIDAPDANWNDYGDLDLRGKTLLMLVNDPGHASGDPALFDGERMTYYGRWTYKFEEAARRGAAAAFVIHDDRGAGYGWDVVRAGGYGRPLFDLPSTIDPAPRLPLRGWLHGDAAARLVAAGGHDLDALRLAAGRRGFVPVELDARLSTTLRSRVRTIESHNVIGRLRGREAADEAVLYLAHWDHFGRNAELDGDQIINGAVDNATGVAAILEIARGFAARSERPRRTLLFAAVTLEESGLLGSRLLASRPPLPLADLVAALNFDALDPRLPRERMVLVGRGRSELDDLLAPIAAGLGIPLADEPAPEKGLYFRSDHFSLARHGVPALVAGLNWSEAYTEQHYHRPSDEFDPDWDLSGVLLEVDALYRLGARLADGDSWPNWHPGTPFRAERDRSRAGRR
jgi:Zn-dependent M28 family amino/carboxypeptidase